MRPESLLTRKTIMDHMEKCMTTGQGPRAWTILLLVIKITKIKHQLKKKANNKNINLS
jgi:hypothetical protein